jgi:phage shock protein E
MSNAIKQKIDAGARIIDVRSSDEFKDGHYPKAENIPVHLITARLPDLGAKDQHIVVYCASGGRSAMAARLLHEAGYRNVVNAGGLDDMPY